MHVFCDIGTICIARSRSIDSELESTAQKTNPGGRDAHAFMLAMFGVALMRGMNKFIRWQPWAKEKACLQQQSNVLSRSECVIIFKNHFLSETSAIHIRKDY